MTKKILPITIVLIIGVVLVVLLGCAPFTQLVETPQKSKQPTSKGTKGQPYPSSAEDVIKAFYKAINDHDYEKAATYATGHLTADFIRMQFEPYIKSVTVTEIIRHPEWDYGGPPMYEVHFNAEYIKHYEAGSGNLLTVHQLKQDEAGHWKVAGIATGP